MKKKWYFYAIIIKEYVKDHRESCECVSCFFFCLESTVFFFCIRCHLDKICWSSSAKHHISIQQDTYSRWRIKFICNNKPKRKRTTTKTVYTKLTTDELLRMCFLFHVFFFFIHFEIRNDESIRDDLSLFVIGAYLPKNWIASTPTITTFWPQVHASCRFLRLLCSILFFFSFRHSVAEC